MAAQRLGWDTIDVYWVDVDEDTAKRIVLVDNKANGTATYDIEALVDLITDLPDLDATGFNRDEVDALLESLDPPEEEPEPEGEPTPEGYGLIVECDAANQRDTLKTRLLAEGFNVGNA